MAAVEDLEGFTFSTSARAVGEGQFGKVLEGTLNRRTVAAKVFSAPAAAGGESNEATVDRLCNGVKAVFSKLRLLPKHANVAEFVGVAGLAVRQPSLVRAEKYSISLAQRANLEPRVEQRQRIDIACDIISGLSFLHGHGIVHGRLGSGNVLLSEVRATQCRVFICDAGLYSVYEDVWGNKDNVRMKWLTPYVSPELELSKAYAATKRSDMFAFGLVILAMEVCREPPSLITNPRSTEPGVNEIERHACDLATVEDSNPLKDVIVKCVQQEAYMRPTSEAVYKLLLSLKLSDEYIAANAVSRGRAHLPPELFSGQGAPLDGEAADILDSHSLHAEADVPGMRSDRVSATSDITYPRLLHRESGAMVMSHSMVSLNDDCSATGGGPSLASDGASVTVDLPRLLGQVRTQLDSLRRSVLIVAHDMDDVRAESQSANRQAWSSHQAAMAARDEAGEARRQATIGTAAALAAQEEASLAHQEAKITKDTCLRILSIITSSVGAQAGRPGLGLGPLAQPPGIESELAAAANMKRVLRDNASLTDIHELQQQQQQQYDLFSNLSDRGSVASLPALLAAAGFDEAPPGHLEGAGGGVGVGTATRAMEPPPGMGADSSLTMTSMLDDGAVKLLGVRDLGGMAAEMGREPDAGRILASYGDHAPGLSQFSAGHLKTSSLGMAMDHDDSHSVRLANTRAAFLAHVRRFDFALKCTLSASASAKPEDLKTDRTDSERDEGIKLRRATSRVFELASRSASQAFPFGEWVSKAEIPLQINGPCHMCVHNDSLYLVSREIIDGNKRTYLVSTTDLEKWSEVKLPASAATCHALFSYGPHVFICARSSDRADKEKRGGGRGAPRGDVMWRLDDEAVGEWSRVTQMPHVQWHYGTAQDGARVIFAGGWDGRREVGHVVVYDLALAQWLDDLTPLPTPGFAAQAFVTNECLYLIGPTTRQVDIGEVFHLCLNPHSPSYNKWRTIKLPETACGACMVNRQIVTVGGWDNNLKQASSTSYVFDADSSEWLMMPSIRVARVRPAVVYFKQKLVCLGGSVNPTRESEKVTWLDVLTLVT